MCLLLWRVATQWKSAEAQNQRASLIVLGVVALAFVVWQCVRQASPIAADSQNKTVTVFAVASTTSAQDSGLFEYLLPIFKQKTGTTVKVLAQGTGQALDTARRGDADVVFVHAKSAEEKFLAEGEGVKRFPVMYNDYVAKAFQTIKEKQACFLSRGDRSGTHIAELNLWKAADTDIEKNSGPWYKSIGQGMGARTQFSQRQ
jgi:tungstate transport system substrate-binding protein